jgi:hypothetical protein
MVAPLFTWGIVSENNDSEFRCIMATARIQSHQATVDRGRKVRIDA